MSELKVAGVEILQDASAISEMTLHLKRWNPSPLFVITNDPYFVVYAKSKAMVRRLSKTTHNIPANSVPISMFNARYKVKN